MNFLVICNGFDHEVRSVANISICPEKNCADADGDDVFVQGNIADQISDFDLFFGDGFGG